MTKWVCKQCGDEDPMTLTWVHSNDSSIIITADEALHDPKGHPEVKHLCPECDNTELCTIEDYWERREEERDYRGI